MELKQKQDFIDELYDKELINMKTRVKIYQHIVKTENNKNFQKAIDEMRRIKREDS